MSEGAAFLANCLAFTDSSESTANRRHVKSLPIKEAFTGKATNEAHGSSSDSCLPRGERAGAGAQSLEVEAFGPNRG
jgi:hypothetical protein